MASRPGRVVSAAEIQLMTNLVDIVLASGVDIIIEGYLVYDVIRKLKIHSLMNQLPLEEELNQSENIQELLLKLVNDLQILNGIPLKQEEQAAKKELQRLEARGANLSTYPSQRFKSFCYDDDDDYDYEKSTIPLNEINSQIPLSIANTSVLEPGESLIMGNEDLNTIPKKESDEFIKVPSVEGRTCFFQSQ
ncbi:hypothetical protein Tco_0138942 [Tanacetum coccineum]